jgi:cytochrome c2
LAEEQEVRRILIITIAILTFLGVISGTAAVTGYYVHKQRIEPAYSLAERAEVWLRRKHKVGSDTEILVDHIETIFLNLTGRVHVMPDRDFKNGGALAVWGDDLIVLHKSGKVFWLDRDEEEGLVLSPLKLPDNGHEGYARLAAEKYPGRPTRIDALRYNDIEFVETPERRGMLLSYTFVDVAQECYRSRVSWLPLPSRISSIRDADVAAGDWNLLYQTSPCLPFNESRELMMAYMAGGRVAFKAPNLVYLGSGEYHREGIYRPDAEIQSDASDYGKTIEINIDTNTARHLSKGHRNLQGVTLDAKGRLWTTEHGMRGGDELNLIVEGENYGWPLENMGALYSGIPAPSPSGPGRHTTYRAPVYAWVPSAAVSSIALLEGFHDAWDGDLLIGSLKARTLFRARIQDDRLVYLEPIPIGQRIRDVMQWGPDRIALWLDLNEIIILEIEPRVNPLDGIADQLIRDGVDSGLAKRAEETLTSCSECHSYEANIHGAGPSLAGVVGQPVAGTAFENYSTALRALPGDWTAERLAAFITAPEAVTEGTSMTGLGVGDADLAETIVAALAKIRSKGPEQ